MQNEFNRQTDRTALGKGVFRPSRAAIAREMEARLKFGGSETKQRPIEPTSSRH